jgi:acetolactate synthase regulatory subunit
MDLVDELRNLISTLQREGIDHAIVGALALAIHGAPRATTDVDLLIRPVDLERVMELVRPLGFDLPALPMTFQQSGLTVHRVTKVEGGESLMLDLILVSEPLEEIWQSREIVHAFDLQLQVISRSALIRMKAMAGRLRDLADIERLEGKDG